MGCAFNYYKRVVPRLQIASLNQTPLFVCQPIHANIGKAVLIQSIGLQKNYIEVKESETSVIDYNNAACTDCKYKAFIKAFAPPPMKLLTSAFVRFGYLK